jgi:multiple sugar transport system substrate-binding protein
MKSSPRRLRLALVAVTALAATTTLAACGSDDGNGGGDGDGGPVTLDVWARDGDNSLDKQVAAFEKAHPDITVDVTLVNNDQYLTKFANSIRAGSVPDLIDFDIINAPLLSTQGQLLDITDKANALPNLADVAEAGIDVGTLDDAVYSLPVALTGSQMFWNKKLFAEAGLDPDAPPKDLAQVKAYAEKIQALGDDVTGFSTIGGVGQAFTGFPSGWADGGDVFTEAGAGTGKRGVRVEG